MIYKIPDILFCESHLPAKGQRELIGHGPPGVLPLGYLTLVVDKIYPAIR